jgi:hypothetical protein
MNQDLCTSTAHTVISKDCQSLVSNARSSHLRNEPTDDCLIAAFTFFGLILSASPFGLTPLEDRSERPSCGIRVGDSGGVRPAG